MTRTGGISGCLIAAAVVNLVFGGMWLIGFLFGIAETATAPLESDRFYTGVGGVLISIVGMGVCGGLAAVSFVARSVIRRSVIGGQPYGRSSNVRPVPALLSVAE